MRTSSQRKKGELGEKSRVRGDMSTKQSFPIFRFCLGPAMHRKLSDLVFFLARNINGLYHIDSTEYSRIVSVHGETFLSLQTWKIC